MVGPKKTLFMDEISTGLDSSTTFQIVKCMRDFVHLREGTVLMSLLQPAPEVYNLFDDILLLSEGMVSAVSGCMLSLCLPVLFSAVTRATFGMYKPRVPGCVPQTQRKSCAGCLWARPTCMDGHAVSL